MARIAMIMLVLACIVSSGFASERLPSPGMSQKEIEELIGKPLEPPGKMINESNSNVRELLYLEADPPRSYTLQEGFCVGIRYYGPDNLGLSRNEASALLKIHAEGNEISSMGEDLWHCPKMRWFAKYDAHRARLYISRRKDVGWK